MIVLEYWSKNIEEYFHLNNPDKNNTSDKSTAQNGKNATNVIVKHVNSMRQVMIGPQDIFIESENERVKQSVCINQLIRENI